MNATIKRAHWYSVDEIAELLGVYPETVRRWIRADQVEAHYLGRGRLGGYRITHDELERVARERYPRMRLVFDEG